MALGKFEVVGKFVVVEKFAGRENLRGGKDLRRATYSHSKVYLTPCICSARISDFTVVTIHCSLLVI